MIMIMRKNKSKTVFFDKINLAKQNVAKRLCEKLQLDLLHKGIEVGNSVD